ncbi:MAG: DUF4330 family protein [Ruminococcaceae bacterium]|nr:DUF4330 family protein [Oscillospiraceae bacterium]
MKIVDENGKIFKKFNIVDAIVVLLVVAVIVAIGWKMISASFAAAAEERKAAEMAEAYETLPHLIFDVVCINQPEEVAKGFVAQMDRPLEERQIMNGGQLVQGYITDCHYELNEETDLCKVYFTCEAVVTEKEGIYSVGTQEVRIGKGYIVKTYEIETSGYVYTMETTGEIVGEVDGND